MFLSFQAKLWSRFFCLSVYVTMYVNDHQRSAFYESIGLNTTQFNMHVLIETNRTTARIFPEVLDVENPEFKARLDRLVEVLTQHPMHCTVFLLFPHHTHTHTVSWLYSDLVFFPWGCNTLKIKRRLTRSSQTSDRAMRRSSSRTQRSCLF